MSRTSEPSSGGESAPEKQEWVVFQDVPISLTQAEIDEQQLGQTDSALGAKSKRLFGNNAHILSIQNVASETAGVYSYLITYRKPKEK